MKKLVRVTVSLCVMFWSRWCGAVPTSYWDYVDLGYSLPTPCRVDPATAPTEYMVYFDPGTLPAADVPAYRAALMRAVAVWNEESMGGRILSYSSAIAPKNPDINQIVVRHVDNPDTVPVLGAGLCSTHPYAHAYTTGSSFGTFGTCSSGRTIWMLLKQCGTLASRRFTPSWVMNTSDVVGVGDLSYEAVVIHELGHALYGFPDVPERFGVMFYAMNPGGGASGLHLYRIDQNSSIEESGPATHRERFRNLAASGTWAGPASAYPIPPSTLDPPISVAPGLASRWLSGSAGAVEAISSLEGAFTFRYGGIGAWTQSPSIVPSSYSSPSPVQSAAALWGRVAVSTYGEIMAVWPECSDLDHCRVATAWTTVYGGSLWILPIHYLDVATIGPVEVEYDQWLDKFVVVGIGTDGRLWTSHCDAWEFSPWAPVNPAAQDPTDANRYRFMGGLYFMRSPSGTFPPRSFVNEHGLLTVASQGGPRPGQIYEYVVRWNESAGAVQLGATSYLVDGGTLRHFETARQAFSDDAITVWVDSSESPQLRTVLRTGSPWGLYGASSGLTWDPSHPVLSSVSIASPTATSADYVVGLSSVTP